MSYAADYATAYRLLREGRVDRKLFDKAFLPTFDYTGSREAAKALRDSVRVDIMGRVQASFFAVKLARQMRKQRSLVTVLCNLKDEAEDREVPREKRLITLFPITVNRNITQVKISDPKDLNA
jgi:hypothetical protein